MPSITALRRLTIDNLNPHVRATKYAVRGELSIRSEELSKALANGSDEFPFHKVVCANIGNPHELGQKPITFFRQVLSLLEYPRLLESEDILLNQLGFKSDVLDRARWLLRQVGSIGSYSPSRGIAAVKESVARFIERRDGYPANPEDIYLTAGASAGVSILMQVICAGPDTGILVPVPQYPIYTASLSILNSRCVPYHLDESRSWTIDIEAIKSAHIAAVSEGIDVRAIVIINPGNPTGTVLSEEDVAAVIGFAAEEKLIVMADEVYQMNVFLGKFHSFKSVLRRLQASVPGKYDNLELASLHSTSKGMIGECGHRGGYFEMVGFDPAVVEQIYKVTSLSLCAPIAGQCMVELMVNPPQEGEPSYDLYKQEHDSIFNGLQERATALYEALKDMEGIECHVPQGSMYLYPKITLPRKAIEKAEELGKFGDEFYCMKLLEETGVCIVPGSGFGQIERTLHLRTTFLPPGTAWAKRIGSFHEKFMIEFK